MPKITDALWGVLLILLPFVAVPAYAEFIAINQGGKRAENIKKILPRINVPNGFDVSLYAIVPDVRSLAVSPGGDVVVAGTHRDKVWVVVDHDGDGVAEDVHDFAPDIRFDIPNGPCFSPDGVLYIIERNRVLSFKTADGALNDPTPKAYEVVPQGALIPVSEESFTHTARICRVGPDGKVYISLGQPYNVQPKEKLKSYDQAGIGGIIRINPDGSEREVYTRGIRNSVGHDFNPANGDLWWTDNQVDGMGDTIPPGELNRQTEAGQHFGFPWVNAGVEIPAYKDVPRPQGIKFIEPQIKTEAHAADLGMRFYQGGSFPAKYHGGIFSAQHGSWDRSDPIGARVMFTALDKAGNATRMDVFADGWKDNNGEYHGRPVDVVFLKDGSMLVSDDQSWAIWRIVYKGGQ